MKWTLVGLSLALALLASWLLWPDEPAPTRRAQARDEPRLRPAEPAEPPPEARSPAPEAEAPAPALRSPASAERRRERDRVRERIYHALGEPPPAQGARPADTDLEHAALGDRPALDAGYVQTRVRQEFHPMAAACYEAALERDPELAGTLVLSFAIVGDESVGGIVESVDIEPESTLSGEELLYCLRESMLSLTFEPPRGSGRVTVTYPFTFAPDEPEEAVDAE